MIDSQAFIRITGIERVVHLRGLPLPPTVNDRLRKSEAARREAARRLRKFHDDIGWLWRKANAPAFARDDRLAMHVVFHAGPRGRDADIDNRLKALNDSLTHAHAWHDDEQVDTLMVERGARMKRGCVDVCIGVLPRESL